MRGKLAIFDPIDGATAALVQWLQAVGAFLYCVKVMN